MAFNQVFGAELCLAGAWEEDVKFSYDNETREKVKVVRWWYAGRGIKHDRYFYANLC